MEAKPIKDKKIFIEKYEEENKKYKKLKEENELREKSKNKRKNKNVGIKKIKFRQNKNNRKAWNYGKCDECKKLKFKRKQPEEEDLIEINLKQKHIRDNQIKKIKLQNIKIKKRDKFIENFFSKSIRLKVQEKANDIFITNLDKKMIIKKDLIIVEEEFILKANLDSSNKYYDSFWMLLDAKNNNIISRKIYIDNIKVDDSQFEVKDYSIKLQFVKILNKKKRKIK